MSFADDRDGERRPKLQSDPESEKLTTSGRKKRRHAAPEVGQALRSAYQRTLSEDIPPEMLDLLGKLG